MQGTLTIQGELTVLAEVASELGLRYPNGLTAKVDPDAWEGWTPDVAATVYKACAWAARTSIELVVRAGGFCADEELREALGKDLTGRVTGPINKHVINMGHKGLIPAGLPKPLEAGYDRRVQLRAAGLRMPDPLVPIFRSMLDQLGDSPA